MSMMIPLFKVDEARREVIGRATQEVIDKSGEILDYESSKENFRKWSEEIYKLSNGKSRGNLRSMHGNTAAGKLINLEFNDAEKAIDVVAKITDDNEWKKVVEGVYTGFSIGGGYEKRWQDPDNPTITRYTAKPTELSLVDNPCIPTAQFYDLVKLDGSIERREIKSLSEKDAAGEVPDQTAGQPLGTTPRNEDELRKQPQMFDDLIKAKWDESKHPREHDGKFARKTGEKIGAAAGAVAGAVGGVALMRGRGGKAITRGVRHAASHAGGALDGGSKASRHMAADRAEESAGRFMREHGDKIGFTGGAVAGGHAGQYMGRKSDEHGRRRRARKAGKAQKFASFAELMKNFDESKVNRDPDGKFAPKGVSGKDVAVAGVGAAAGAIAGKRSAAVRAAARQIGDAVSGFQTGLAAGSRGKKNLATSIARGVKSGQRRAAAGRKYDASLASRSRKGPGYSMGPGGEAKAMRAMRDKMGVRSATVTGAVAAGAVHNVTRRDQKIQQQDDGNARKAVLFNDLLKFDESKIKRDEKGRFAPKSGNSDSFNTGEIAGGVVGSTLGSEVGHEWGKKQGFDVARRARGLAGTAGGLIGVAAGREIQRKLESRKAVMFGDLYKADGVVQVSSYTRKGPDGKPVEVKAHTRGGGPSVAGVAGAAAGSALAVGATIAAFRRGKVVAARKAAVEAQKVASRARLDKLQASLKRTKEGSKRNKEITAEIKQINESLVQLDQRGFVEGMVKQLGKAGAKAGDSLKSALKSVLKGVKDDVRTGNITNLRRKATILAGAASIGGVLGDLVSGHRRLRFDRQVRPDGSTFMEFTLRDNRTGETTFIYSYDSVHGSKYAPMGAMVSSYLGLREGQQRNQVSSNTQPGSRTVVGVGADATLPDSPFHPSRNNAKNYSGIRIDNPSFKESTQNNFDDVKQRLFSTLRDIRDGTGDTRRKALDQKNKIDVSIIGRDWTDEAKSRALTISRFGRVSVSANEVRNHLSSIVNLAEREPKTVLDGSRYQANLAFARYAPFIPRDERLKFENDLKRAHQSARQAENARTGSSTPPSFGSGSAEEARRAVEAELGEELFDFGKSAPVSFAKAYGNLSDPDRPLKKAASLAKAIPPFPGESRQAYVDRILLNAGV